MNDFKLLQKGDAEHVREIALRVLGAVRLPTEREASALRNQSRMACISPNGELEVIAATGRAICRCCGKKIAKGEIAYRFDYDFTGSGSWTVVPAQIHANDCAAPAAEQAAAPAPAAPKRLTFKAVNKELAKRPGYAGEELVQGNGYLYFMEGNASAWRGGSSIPVCRLSHTSMESILADFDRFVSEHAEQMSLYAVPSVADTLMEMAKATMLEQFKESSWFKTSPAASSAIDPVITITGIENRRVFLSMGMMSSGEEMRPFLCGRVEIAGVSAKLCMRFEFGAGGLLVLEGEA